MRLTQVDTAKLLAIYLVIVSHCGISEIYPFLYSFHVQFFFIISGFCYKYKSQSIIDYLKNDLKKSFYRIYVPYLLLAFILGSPLNRFSFPSIIWGSDQLISTTTSSHLWFLPCFFASTILFHLLNIVIRKRIVLLCVIIFSAFVSSLLAFDSNVVLHGSTVTYHFTGSPQPTDQYDLYVGFPFDFNVALTGVVFMYIGSVLRKVYDKITLQVFKRYSVVVLVPFLVVGYFSYNENLANIPITWSHPMTAMSWGVYGNYIWFLSTSICLSIGLFCIACIVDNKVFAKYGRYTLSIYAFHVVVLNTFSPLMDKIMGVCVIPLWMMYILFSIPVLVICILLIPIIRRIDKTLIGE